MLVQKLFYRFFYNWMYNGKLTFSTPSTHPKKNAKCWREKNVSGKHILQEHKFMTNEWFKKKSILQQTTQPFPPGTLKSKVVAWPLNVLRPLLWFFVVRFLQGATSSKQPVNFIILVAFLCEVRLKYKQTY